MTLTSILIAVRELAFDRYPMPVFVLKQKAGKFLSNSANNFRILPAAASPTPDYSYTYTPAGSSDTLENLTQALISNGYPIAYTGYYSATDAPSSLLLLTDASLAQNMQMFRRFFLSDIKIQNILIDYYRIVLGDDTQTTATLAASVLLLENAIARHLTIWVAIQLVELRRVAELSAGVFQMNFTDGTGAVAGSNLSTPGDNITVSIGSVFSITDDNSITSQYFQEDFNRVGSDNVLGDKESFWFKLFLNLRRTIESEYNDFYFRQDNVIVGNITLIKDLNQNTYYDSYPFTTNTNRRGIID